MAWWVVRATQDEVMAQLRAAQIRAQVSPSSRTGWVCAVLFDLDQAPALLPDRDQFEITESADGSRVSGWTTTGVDLDWAPRSDDPVATERAVEFFASLGAVRDDVRPLVMSRPDVSSLRFYLELLPHIGLPAPDGSGSVIVAFDGDPEMARRIGHLFGPTTLITGDAGWTYLRFPAMELKQSVIALGLLSKVGRSSTPFLISRQNTGWFARFQLTQGEHFMIGPTWRRVDEHSAETRRYDATRTEFLVAEGRGPEVVESLLARADAGELLLGDFLARFGLPTFAARLTGTFADEVGQRAEHLAKLTLDEIKAANARGQVYSFTAPAHSVLAGFMLAAGTFFLLMTALAAGTQRTGAAMITIVIGLLLLGSGSALWRRRGRVPPVAVRRKRVS